MADPRCECCKMTAAVTGDEPQAVHCDHCGSELGICEGCARESAPLVCLGCQSHGVNVCTTCGKPVAVNGSFCSEACESKWVAENPEQAREEGLE